MAQNLWPQMTALAERFPCLRGVDGVSPFDVDALAAWAKKNPRCTHAGTHAVAFLLSVWNGRPEAFGLRPFHFTNAWGTWDDDHREAFLAWARDPFWP